MQKLVAAALVLALAACGQAGPHRPSGSAGDNEVCQMLGDPTALFGANTSVAGYRGIEDMGPTCEFSSADGVRNGEIVTFTTASLKGATLQAKMQETLAKWDALTATPLTSVAGLGEGAQMATDLPGYQTQIAFIKGDTLVLIQARTGDADTARGADLARRMATTVAAALH
ncbi:MAG TPA: hypothetical protein VHC73_10735 [Vitreimonas sp.]|nr:hypothetical protein [Vitreimonas sp.]